MSVRDVIFTVNCLNSTSFFRENLLGNSIVRSGPVRYTQTIASVSCTTIIESTEERTNLKACMFLRLAWEIWQESHERLSCQDLITEKDYFDVTGNSSFSGKNQKSE